MPLRGIAIFLMILAAFLGVPWLGRIVAVLSWQRRPWGYTPAPVLIVKTLMRGAALIAMIIGQILAGIAVSPVEIIMFSGIALAALVFTVALFRHVKT